MHFAIANKSTYLIFNLPKKSIGSKELKAKFLDQNSRFPCLITLLFLDKNKDSNHFWSKESVMDKHEIREF